MNQVVKHILKAVIVSALAALLEAIANETRTSEKEVN